MSTRKRLEIDIKKAEGKEFVFTPLDFPKYKVTKNGVEKEISFENYPFEAPKINDVKLEEWHLSDSFHTKIDLFFSGNTFRENKYLTEKNDSGCNLKKNIFYNDEKTFKEFYEKFRNKDGVVNTFEPLACIVKYYHPSTTDTQRRELKEKFKITKENDGGEKTLCDINIIVGAQNSWDDDFGRKDDVSSEIEPHLGFYNVFIGGGECKDDRQYDMYTINYPDIGKYYKKLGIEVDESLHKKRTDDLLFIHNFVNRVNLDRATFYNLKYDYLLFCSLWLKPKHYFIYDCIYNLPIVLKKDFKEENYINEFKTTFDFKKTPLPLPALFLPSEFKEIMFGERIPVPYENFLPFLKEKFNSIGMDLSFVMNSDNKYYYIVACKKESLDGKSKLKKFKTKKYNNNKSLKVKSRTRGSKKRRSLKVKSRTRRSKKRRS